MIATGLLIARLFVGLAIAAHGAQKAFGWFGGYGLKGTAGFFETLGYKPGVLFAALGSYGEIVGGLLTALGLFGPIGPALIVLVMIVAVGTIHLPNGFFAAKNGFELNSFYVAAALALSFGGPGDYSLDRVLGFSAYFNTQVDTTAIASAVVIGLVTLAFRHTPPSGEGQTAVRPGA
jgi:putative oxidoreductase